jgi:hypothetical protein
MTDILARQRTLIGTTAQWALNNLVIGDGEIALERPVSGSVRMKVGNGVATFSALPYSPPVGGAFGDKYTWRTLTGSRSDGTNYTGPDHPIMVSYIAEFLSNSGTCAMLVGGLQVGVAANGGNGAMYETLTAIVPPGTVYRVNTSGLNGRAWFELRAD